MTTGGKLIAETLGAFGVRDAFGVHGGHLDAFLTGLVEVGINVWDVRHEAAGGNAAEGYARATGGLGVAFATSGPGFANAYSALANAMIDRIPLLLVTSSPPTRETELNVLQGGLDQVAAARTVAKFVLRPTTAARLPDLTALAVRHALTGVPGPVVLDVPIDVMFREVDPALATTPVVRLPAPPAPAPAAMDEVVDLLRRAERPLLVLGGGASLSLGSAPALADLLDRVPMPVGVSSWGYGVIAPDHPCFAGGPADLAAIPFLAAAPDVVVLVGARRGIQLGGRESGFIPPGTKVVQVDLDGAEPGRVGDLEAALVADVTEFLCALTARSDDLPGWAAWTASVVGTRHAHAMLYGEPPAAPVPDVVPDDRLHPYFVAKAVAESLQPTDTLVYDGGETAGWINFFGRAGRPRGWFGLGNLGGLGVGPGFAIGAQTGRPDGHTVLVTGDGAIGFHLQELETMARLELPITIVVFNNLGWGMSFHGQDIVYGAGSRVASDLPDIRYDTIAESLGLHGERVTRLDEIGPALARARAAGGPACLDIAVDPAIVHPIMDALAADLPEGALRIPYYEPVPAGES